MTSVDVVVPVRNEERCLEQSVRQLHAALCAMPGLVARIVIADNGSSDSTARVAARLSRGLPRVRVLRLEQPGRGRALRAAWSTSTADVVAYMDADLSTGLSALPTAVGMVASGAADMAIGSRLLRASRVQRSLRREVISRVYNHLLRAFLGVRFRDAQCGFKVLRADVARRVLPAVQDQNWFFDTELLVRAERAGLRVAEVPVTWVEDRNSSVAITRTALEDLRGMARLRRELGPARVRPQPVFAQQAMRSALMVHSDVVSASLVATAARFAVLRSLGAPSRSGSPRAHR